MQSSGRAACWVGALACAFVIAAGCGADLSRGDQRPIGTIGAEVFRLVCMNLAAQAFPNDMTGERFTSRCEGKDNTAFTELTPTKEEEKYSLARFNVLLARRQYLVPALESVLASSTFQNDELRGFLDGLLPLYDPPKELLPEVTREWAALLQHLISHDDEVNKDAIRAFERMGSREGYRPLRLALGVARAALAYDGLDTLVHTSLGSLDPDTGDARKEWHELLRAAALDLATADATPPDPQAPGTLAVARKLLFASDAAFSSGRGALYLAARDHRGMVRPIVSSGSLPDPFVDSDGDGFADLDPVGRFVLSAGDLPAPFKTLTDAMLGTDAARRDAFGRAISPTAQARDICAGTTRAPGCGAVCDAETPCGAGLACGGDSKCSWDEEAPLLYDYLDADRTLLAGVTRDVGPLLLPKHKDQTLTAAPILDFAYGLNALLGDYKQRSHSFGAAKLAFVGPDTATGPIFDLVYALGTFMPFDETDQLLQVIEVLMRDHEKEVAGLIEAILYIKERSNEYPGAHWERRHEFWDDLIAWTQRALRRPGMFEAILRALTSEQTAKLGPALGNLMRFKDRVTYPLGRQEELEALGIDMKQVVGKLDDHLSQAVEDHRSNVNYPCENPPRDLVGPGVSDPGCLPNAPHPAKHHKGVRGCAADAPDCGRGCPAAQPTHGKSCAQAGGYGLCSWDTGSCTCDCGGGLCRGDMTPTWTCEDAAGAPLAPVAGYSQWVDRTQPDVRAGADGQSNQSILQRSAALVHDLHVPTSLCNREGAVMRLYTPAGSNSELLGGTLGTAGGLLGPFKSCELLAERQVAQIFARSIIGTAVLQLKGETLAGLLHLVDSLGLGGAGLSSDSIMERQTQIRGLFVNHPTPQAIARLVFAPSNSFEQGLLDLPVTGDNLLIVDRHRDTLFAWELEDPVAHASFYEGLVPVLEAFDNHELRDENGELTDGYLFGDIIRLIHLHWSSRRADTTVRDCDDTKSPPVCNLDTPLFAYQSNGVSYEDLMAEALVDAQLLSRVRDVMLALDNIEVAPGVDGISVLAKVSENLLDPRKSCLDGDCTKHPLRARNGATSTVTNTGEKIDQLTPAHLLFDALNAIDRRFEGDNEKRLTPWREARSQLVDLWLDVDRTGPGDWHFKNPHSRPVLIHVIEFLRDRLATRRAEQAECLMKNGNENAKCPQLRDWSVGLARRLEASLGHPSSAAILRLLDRLRGLEGDPGGQLLGLMHAMSRELATASKSGDNDAFDSTLLASHDMLQLLENTENTAPIMRFFSQAIAPNAVQVADTGSGELKIEEGAIEKTLALLRAPRKLEPKTDGRASTLTKLLREMVHVTGPNGASPLEIIIDTIAEVNRAAPGKDNGKALDAADLRSVLDESQQFLSSNRHGLERLYDIAQSRSLP